MKRNSGFMRGALLAVLGVLFVAAPLWAATTGKLEGVVTDTQTGKPVPFCNVVIPSLQRGVTTDEQGYYFLINIPAARYDVRVSIIGYEPMVRTNVTIVPDFTTTLNVQLNPTTATTLKETTVTGERPLIQKDATGTTRVITGEEIRQLPTRGYRDAVAQQSGVVTEGKYANDTEASNVPSLFIRGGRSNSVAYYVDGVSTQDPLSGTSNTAINQNAVEEVSTMTGGFNAEYGRVSSGIVNVITKEGGKRLEGSLEGLTDYGIDKWSSARSYGYLTYNGSLSGPVVSDKLTFFVAGEARNNRDRQPRPNIFDPFGNAISVGRLPNNQEVGLTWQGKLAWRPDNLTNVKLSILGSRDNWQNYLNAYRFDVGHTPKYHDYANTASLTLNRTLNNRSFISALLSYNTGERTRGDGVYGSDVLLYSKGFRAENEDTLGVAPTNPLFVFNNDFFAAGHIEDDFLHRKSSYVGAKADYSNQINRHHTIKFGADIQRHSLKYYRHLFPTRMGTPGYGNQDVVNYGFDEFGREIETPFSYVDSAGVPIPTVVDSSGALVNVPVPAGAIQVPNLNNAKHPILAAAYFQDKIEFEGLIANVGLRWDYLAARTPRLVDPTHPLGANGQLQLADAQASTKLSPRIGVSFPVTDRTDFRFNYGLFYQMPDLQYLYTNYDYLAYKIRTGGYYYAFGNPNLEPERTTQIEVGATQMLTPRSAVDVAVWYKDIQNLVEVKTQPSVPNNFASFYNADFGTLRGIDLGYTLRRSHHFQGFANYTISWARGTGSTPQSQRNIAWYASNDAPAPKFIAPLDFDVRHKISASLGYESDPAHAGGTVSSILAGAGITALFNAQSGTPYTPVKIFDEVTQLAQANSVNGDLNSRAKPWNMSVDVRAHKDISLGSTTSLDLQLYVYNLFNRLNPSSVYLGTGDPLITGYLNSPAAISLTPEDRAAYELAQRDPLNFDNPRMIRFGAVMKF